jgi:uncharacterized protein YjiS (DUF1127 family)
MEGKMTFEEREKRIQLIEKAMEWLKAERTRLLLEQLLEVVGDVEAISNSIPQDAEGLSPEVKL